MSLRDEKRRQVHLVVPGGSWYTLGFLNLADSLDFSRLFPSGTKMANGVVTIPISGQPLVCDPSLDGEHGNPVALNEFFAGPENLLVEPAVQSVLGRRSTRYNPLVLYGPSGTGKSHLARGIATAWKANSPGNRVVYITAVDFARQWADAIEAQAVEEFRADFRTADLVIVENLGELLGKPSAQEELVRTLDVVMRHDTQVVVTARVAPIALAELSTALQSPIDGRVGCSFGAAGTGSAAGRFTALGPPATGRFVGSHSPHFWPTGWAALCRSYFRRCSNWSYRFDRMGERSTLRPCVSFWRSVMPNSFRFARSRLWQPGISR